MIYENIIYCETLGIKHATFCLYYYSNRRRIPVFPLLYIIGKNAKNLLKKEKGLTQLYQSYVSKLVTLTGFGPVNVALRGR